LEILKKSLPHSHFAIVNHGDGIPLFELFAVAKLEKKYHCLNIYLYEKFFDFHSARVSKSGSVRPKNLPQISGLSS